MSNDFQTYASLSTTLGISVAAIKSWRRKFPGALPLMTRGKPLRFAPEALEACRAIRDGYGEGRSSAEIRALLEATLPWMGRAPGAVGPMDGASAGTAGGPAPGAPPPADSAALETLARTMAELLAEQRENARRLERLEQRLEQMHGHPRLLEELRALKRRQEQNVQAVREGLGEKDYAPEQPKTTAPEAAVVEQSTGTDEPLAAEGGVEQETAAPGADEQATVSSTPGEPSGRVVRIRTRSGEYERYELKPLGRETPEEPNEPDAAAAAPGTVRTERPAPPDEFLDLPVVAQDARGDYLGVARLTVRTMAARLEYGSTWERRGELWLLTLNTLPAQTLTLTPTVTPRGNRVAALTRLATPNSEVDAAGRIEFLRSLRR